VTKSCCTAWSRSAISGGTDVVVVATGAVVVVATVVVARPHRECRRRHEHDDADAAQTCRHHALPLPVRDTDPSVEIVEVGEWFDRASTAARSRCAGAPEVA